MALRQNRDLGRPEESERDGDAVPARFTSPSPWCKPTGTQRGDGGARLVATASLQRAGLRGGTAERWGWTTIPIYTASSQAEAVIQAANAIMQLPSDGTMATQLDRIASLLR